MTTQPIVDAVQEIVAEMQYLLGVADESPEAAETEVLDSPQG